ncbi:MAG: KH domain-containing protein [Chloroflexi bacterium CFX4]|nr:KH domain-containing protein [Chloroflexi bacterium CFX4]MDL1922940.1 KH domain-containing protein [Chloroflexi bacterium CFX3]
MSQILSIESVGADVEAAIAKGIAELGVSRDQVMVEVLEEAGRRLLGLGAKPARVRLTVIRAPQTPTPAAEPISTSEAHQAAESAPKAKRPQPKPKAPAKPRTAKATTEADVLPFEEEDDEAAEPASEQQLAEAAKVGEVVLRQLLHSMGITATVTAQPAQKQSGEPQHWTLDVRGSDLSELIGRRGETLASLQYITRLITSREIGHRAHIVVDVDGYKARREEMLRRLAFRMAEQAIQRGRTVSMEPMPPHERRIVHLTLKDNPDVSTESVGEGENRKVTIVPRRPQQ